MVSNASSLLSFLLAWLSLFVEAFKSCCTSRSNSLYCVLVGFNVCWKIQWSSKIKNHYMTYYSHRLFVKPLHYEKKPIIEQIE